MNTELPKTATRTGTIKRRHGYAGGSCHGQSAIYEDGTPGIGHSWPVEEFLGRDLPHGSVVRVTVEVIKETDTPWPANPWHLNRRVRVDCACQPPIQDPYAPADNKSWDVT